MTTSTIARVFLIVTSLYAANAVAQGQDGTPTDRDLTIIAEMLPATYDNTEQVYFDGRRGVREEAKHERVTSSITRVSAPAFGDYVFFARDHRNKEPEKPHRIRLYALSADNDKEAVRMKMYYIDGEGMPEAYKDAHIDPSVLADVTPKTSMVLDGCDVFWRREAGQFHGAMKDGACRWEWPDKGEVVTDYHMMLSEDFFWVRDGTHDSDGNRLTGNPDRIYHKLTRARDFTCYADMPGVSGGRDIPFTRFSDLKITDQGGLARFVSNEETPRTIQISLRNVDWQINNETGAYTRDSLVMYISSRNEDGSPGEFFGYTFTQPDAERLGINLGFILVNCYIVSNRDATPEF